MTFATGRYDGLSHLHVLLDNPRAGVMQVIAFEPGDTTPQPWVFADLETYMTWNWNVRTSFNVIRSLIDRFQFEGATTSSSPRRSPNSGASTSRTTSSTTSTGGSVG